jgi:hypothetical protein
MAYSVKIDQILAEIDKRNFSLYDAIEEDEELLAEINKLLGFMLPVWMAGAINDQQHQEAILAFDEIANTGWYKLKDHPKLQMLLLCATGNGKPVRHKFMASGARKEYSKIHDVFLRRYPDIRKEDVKAWSRKHTSQDFENLLRGLGEQEKEIKEIVKEFVSFQKEL